MHRRFNITKLALTSALLLTCVFSSFIACAAPPAPKGKTPLKDKIHALQLSIDHLVKQYPNQYDTNRELRNKLATLRDHINAKTNPTTDKQITTLAQIALVNRNPVIDFNELIFVKRQKGQLGLPANHMCNADLEQTGYDNEIARLSPIKPGGKQSTLFRPSGTRFVGEIDLHYDADRLMFSMPEDGNWSLFQANTDTGSVTRLTPPDPGVDNFDGTYLPDGAVIYASTASCTAVPCWHGLKTACSLYRIEPDQKTIRQLCFDQDLDLHPSVLNDGRVVFSRWEYTGIMHMYQRPLIAMNPDGTNQRALYGSNSYWPNALYYPRAIPGHHGKIIAVAAGYHSAPYRSGKLALIDTNTGFNEAGGVLQLIPGRGKPVKTEIVDNQYKGDWPKFLQPFPIDDTYFLAAAQLKNNGPWGIYLLDLYDNVVPILADNKHDYFEPTPRRKITPPPAIPSRVDLTKKDAVVYLHDVYAGPGLAGVPRGVVKSMRVVSYHFGYPGLAGPDKIGWGGPWDAMRIHGTVPVQEDGSAMFKVPANTPLTLQPLDEEGKAVQLMRSWFTAMPGENISCVGCHDKPLQTPLSTHSFAANKPPDEIKPWHGPARGFDFQREVQPVLNEYCVGCHNGATPDTPDTPATNSKTQPAIADLRDESFFPNYNGRQLTTLGATRLHPTTVDFLGGTRMRYTPAYDALVPYIRRVGIEDDAHLLKPGEYHADTSPLIQMLQKGHHNVKLDAEALDRLVTWIDLNGPCHGTWGDAAPVPDQVVAKRANLRDRYAGQDDTPEATFPIQSENIKPIMPQPLARKKLNLKIPAHWPLTNQQAKRRQLNTGDQIEKNIDLGSGITLRLVKVPAGSFVMGELNSLPDETPTVTHIENDFWMGSFEITNRQFQQFNPQHNSGYFSKRFASMDGPGLDLNNPDQPAVRISWLQARDFCNWLSEKTGATFTLPTEAQWEYACRAGAASPLSYGNLDDDFSTFANLADNALKLPTSRTGGVTTSLTNPDGHLKGILLESQEGGNIPCESRFDDGAITTTPVGTFQPNAWGLHDMHGNAAEWASIQTKRNPTPTDRMAIRGGSWVDTPNRSRSAFRLTYPAWQPVHNAGFRVVLEINNINDTAPVISEE